ncbi:hypothetical protein JCM10212_003016 [Sporobolomyces blumeae]
MSRRAAFSGQLTGEDPAPARAPSGAPRTGPSTTSSTPRPPTSSPGTSHRGGDGGSPTTRGGAKGKGRQGQGSGPGPRGSGQHPPHRSASHGATALSTTTRDAPIPPVQVTPENLAAIAAAAVAKADAERRLARKNSGTAGDDDDDDGEEDDDDGGDGQICFICAEPVQYWALGKCNHRTCHTCSIRLRALYKKKECTFCKTECSSVIFTESESNLFEEYTPDMTPFSDTKLGILFETRAQLEDTLSLLRFNCPFRPSPSSTASSSSGPESDSTSLSKTTPGTTPSEPCPQILSGWSDLKRHVRAAHHTTLCDLCCSNKKIFAHEHDLFALPHSAPSNRGGGGGGGGGRRESELDQHLEKQHAMCGFCKRWFYDSDGLYKHCRDAHEECFVCVRMGIRHQYHLNYDRLEQHFKTAHYLCPHPECLAQKFVVFESELDLQAHALSEHGVGSFGGPGGGAGGSDQKSRKEARRIETNFVYSTGGTDSGSGSGSARAGRNARGGATREGAAASFVEPPPQRQALGERAVPGLGGAGGARANRGGFTGQLTPSGGPSPSGSGANTPNGSTGGSVRDPETLARHAGLMKKVQDAVGNNEGRIAAFRFAVRSYRTNETSASDLVDQLFNILDQRVDEAGSLIRGTAELFDEQDKRQAILNAWRDTMNEQNQFPSLAPLAPTLNGVPTHANPTSARALSAQHRSAQHNPSTTWDRVERAATSSGPAAIQPRSNPFPALMSASNAKNIVGLRNAGGAAGKKRVVGGSTPWSAAGSSGSNAPQAQAFPALSGAHPTLARQPSPGSFPTLSSSSAQLVSAASSRPSSSSVSSPSTTASRVASSSSLNRKAAPPRASSGLEFPSLPSSSAAADARARMRAALQKPGQLGRTITDEGTTPPGERDAWGTGDGDVGDREGGWGGGAAGGGGGGAAARKKGKGRQKVVLMSGGLASGR